MSDVTTTETSADPKAPVPAAAAPPATSGSPAAADGTGTQKSKINVDAAVKADFKWKQDRKKQETEIQTTKAQLAEQAKRYEIIPPEVIEHLTKGELVEAILKLEKGKLDQDQLLKLADVVAARHAEAKPLTAEEARKAAREEIAAEKAAELKKEEEAKTAKKAAEEKEWEEEISTYTSKLCGEFIEKPENAAKYPAFHAWATADDDEEIVAAKAAVIKREMNRRVGVNIAANRVAEPTDWDTVAAHFEAKEIAKRPKVEEKPNAPVTLADLEKHLREQAAALMPEVKPPIITIDTGGDGFAAKTDGIPKTGGGVLDEIYAKARAMDKVKRAAEAQRKF